MKIKKYIIILQVMLVTSACDNYLDVVPDNVATIEYAFRMRATTERYLYTCYSYLPQLGNRDTGPVLFGGDELWWVRESWGSNPWQIARGNQNVNSPYLDYWNSTFPLWRGIRECNIFLENIMDVKDVEDFEKRKWAAEVKFLKAYYHFFLLKMYGPVPIIKENLPVSASEEDVRVERRPVDEVFDYVIELMDEAIEDLPDRVEDENSELGRITLPIALGIKAKILVYAASPLFNGNTDYASYTNKDGTVLFNQTYNVEKWQKAAEACKYAIDFCHALDMKLYYFEETNLVRNLPEMLTTEMNLRNAFTERWNSEIIWAHTKNNARDLQVNAMPKTLPAAAVGFGPSEGHIAVPMRIANLFYTKNGVPIDEDVQWSYANRFDLREGSEEERYQIKQGYVTARYNFDRETRFYSTLGFDGGIWFGQGNYNPEAPYWLELKLGQSGGKRGNLNHTVTGYYPKKYIYYTNVQSTTASTYTSTNYPWPMLRLSDLYLLYAEALNEVQGPTEDIFIYLDMIRARAGLAGVKESWDNYSRTPNKYNSQQGLREIIQRERAIELALEGQRFWDLRRWKTALETYNGVISGWDMDQETPEDYYTEKVIFDQTFSLKDYFWPIRESDLIVNKNLVQSPGW
jgi:hypothetical protein